MLNCFVSIPFGKKNDIDGRVLDFDFLYAEIIRPTVKELGLECFRLDEIPPSAIIQKTLITALITSDLMIADISTHNPNVMYEIGIRHAMKRGRTLLISAGGRLPWDINYMPILQYQTDSFGHVGDESALLFRETLQTAIRQSQRATISDSPIYEFFPDIDVILPLELDNDRRQQRVRSTKTERGFEQATIESPQRTISRLKKSEEEVRDASQFDPDKYLILLRKYRDLSEWDRVVTLATEAPAEIANSPEVLHLLALALNRRGNPGDQDRAILLMEQLVTETGGDSETFSILGLIYKDRYDRAKLQNDIKSIDIFLDKAINYYRKGFEKSPKDYYLGINVVTLLLQQNDVTSQMELEVIVPLIRAAVQEKIESGYPEYWDFSTELELAVVTKDWTKAKQSAQMAVARAPSEWMLETTLRSIQLFAKDLVTAEDREQLEIVLGYLRQGDGGEEMTNDRLR